MYTRYELDPSCKHDLFIYLYKNVKNVKELLIKAKEGSLECALINPINIYDAFQIVVAANKAVVFHETDRLKTRSIYSEIIYNLSPSKNILKSLTAFGIKEQKDHSDKEVDVLVAVLKDKDSESIEENLPFIDGKLCPIKELNNLKNLTQIEKSYNVNGNNLLGQITSIIAAK